MATLAIFDWPGAVKNACWGASPNPALVLYTGAKREWCNRQSDGCPKRVGRHLDMDGVAGCFERPLHINDGGFLYHCFKLVFFRQQSGNNLQLHPAQKERMISWVMESTSQRKSGSVSASCVRASSSRSLCAAVFGAIDVRSMGRGSSRHLLRGSRVGSPNTSFNLTLSLGRITISPG